MYHKYLLVLKTVDSHDDQSHTDLEVKMIIYLQNKETLKGVNLPSLLLY